MAWRVTKRVLINSPLSLMINCMLRTALHIQACRTSINPHTKCAFALFPALSDAGCSHALTWQRDGKLAVGRQRIEVRIRLQQRTTCPSFRRAHSLPGSSEAQRGLCAASASHSCCMGKRLVPPGPSPKAMSCCEPGITIFQSMMESGAGCEGTEGP